MQASPETATSVPHFTNPKSVQKTGTYPAWIGTETLSTSSLVPFFNNTAAGILEANIEQGRSTASEMLREDPDLSSFQVLKEAKNETLLRSIFKKDEMGNITHVKTEVFRNTPYPFFPFFNQPSIQATITGDPKDGAPITIQVPGLSSTLTIKDGKLANIKYPLKDAVTETPKILGTHLTLFFHFSINQAYKQR